MKITDVRLFRVEGEGPAWVFEDRSVEPLDLYPSHVGPSAGAGDASSRLAATYVEIDTDEEVSGLYGPIDSRQAGLIAGDLREFVLGEDPLATALLHDRMLRLHRHGRAGLFVNAISAVDNALWDLRGKAAGEPVYRLLGGPTRDRVPAYASMLGYSVDPERAAVAAREHAELGFAAQKWFFRYGPGAGRDGMLANLAMARAVREAVGPGYPLMFDAFMGWDPTYAADMLRGLEDVEPYWVEEPLPPERVSAFRRLAASSRIRLATGEHAHTRWQIKELLDSGAIGVVQADQDWAGGITEQLHICSLCSAYDVPVVAHGHAVPAALHVAASQSPRTVPMLEYLVRVQERNQFFQRTIHRAESGSIALPTGPGLGIDLDGSKIEVRRELGSDA
ncbi:MAG TPA: enolase C-terminal domain-like protein [Actinomycetota bacterium]|jgi:L-rhamnonate dehydratase|nr:enolase C-terminal domain-like protein [Actinomycetota bacterium]